ncbi:MAG: selenide, water dikinase SelD [Flavobacteriales bacterium]|nr:selenide, water dikinase SelD [Flavobacteriales bacterium]
MEKPSDPVRLTQFSHGGGCGCKISPSVLKDILGQGTDAGLFPDLMIGNSTSDDAAVMAIDGERAIISTTDFFMPIVDDPHDFGGIAAVNAISDIYAMGGKPLMAIAILGWPVAKLAPEIAAQVIAGAREACSRAGIPLAGGHSIDSPEPIFGLAVTGIADRHQIKANSTATEGCGLFLTKPLGVGIMATAGKRGLLGDDDRARLTAQMLTLNSIGERLGGMRSVMAITDVTGFGLLGHLIEMCEGSGLSAVIDYSKIPLIEGLQHYLDLSIYPDMTMRNFQSYGSKVSTLTGPQLFTLCDPQTSGGLLLAVEPAGREEVVSCCKEAGVVLHPIGSMVRRGDRAVTVQ